MGKVVRVVALTGLLVLVMTAQASAAPGDITLVAGRGGPGHGGDGGAAVAAQLTFPEDCEFGPGGVTYVAEDLHIRRIGPDGVISTFNTGVWPFGLAVDADGTVYVADANPTSPRIVTITPDGVLRRIAGTGQGPGFSGDGGPATEAQMGQPGSLALTKDAVYFADAVSGGVRRVDLATGTIDSVPQLAHIQKIAAGPDGTLYGISFGTNMIVALGTDGDVRPFAGNGTAGFSGDGGPATSAALDNPLALAVDAAGTVFVSDANNRRIRRIGVDGIITTIAGTGGQGVTGDGGPAIAATLVFPRGLGVAPAGGLCVADTGGGVVRSISGAAAPTPPITTVTPVVTPEEPTTQPLPTAIPATGSDLTPVNVGAAFLMSGAIAVLVAGVGVRRRQFRGRA